ncbi:hypothetical protein DPQ22_08500 [Candidatus Tokpelaia sp.]|nr:hypothetical protein DPQ22_08500 [Candidatus Tokpelaia sp.]
MSAWSFFEPSHISLLSAFSCCRDFSAFITGRIGALSNPYCNSQWKSLSKGVCAVLSNAVNSGMS